MRVEIHPPESIRFASDCVGFDGFRVVVIELPDEGEAVWGDVGIPALGSLAVRSKKKAARSSLLRRIPRVC